MKQTLANIFAWLFCAGILFLILTPQLHCQQFDRVILIIMENRTPDNLFHGLCGLPGYDINCGTWQHNSAAVLPLPVHLGAPCPGPDCYDLGHSHAAWLKQWNNNKLDGQSQCTGTCPANANAHYVDPADVPEYLALAQQYGFANRMFQTNQGPSYPAHQFLFGGTSAPDAASDSLGLFVAENTNAQNGCLSLPGTLAQEINAAGAEIAANRVFPCYERPTMADLGLSWKYYTPGVKNIWTAPTSIRHLCQPVNGKCTGSQWSNVVLNPSDILSDISAGKLAQLSWVIPTGQCSDHAGTNTGCGPAWVSSIVNAVGQSSYWQSTAILVVWDDWGGWYDHVAPPNGNSGYANGGFRVPLLFISAYTGSGTISNKQSEFGSILRFVEFNFGVGEGALGFDDARSQSDLSEFYDFTQAPRAYVSVAARAVPRLDVASDPDDDGDEQ